MIKLGIIISHPIQYYAPLFSLLAKSEYLKIKVYYTWNPDKSSCFDPGFKKSVKWDIPLLSGYDYVFSRNDSKDPGTHHYFGLNNPELIEEIENWNPDAIFVYGWKYKSHLQVLKYFKDKKPIFFRGDSHNLDELSLLKKLLRNVILRWVFRKIDYALYVGENNRNYFKEAGINEKQLIWAPHSIDNYRFSNNSDELEHEAQQWRNSLSIPSESVVVLFAGKFEAKKEPLLLLSVASDLADFDIYFVFAGNGKFESDIITASNNHKHIKYLPFQNQSKMPLLYRIGDILCLPSSREESWGLAVNEAMACGRAVIVSNKVGCGIDLVKHGVNGYVFDVNYSNELKEILKSIIDGREKLKEMGRKSLDIISNWSIEKQSEIIQREIVSRLKYEEKSFSVVE